MKAFKLIYLEISEAEVEDWSRADKRVYFKTFEEAREAQMKKGLKKIARHQQEIERVENILGINCQKPEKVTYPVKMCKGCNTKSFIETGNYTGFCTNCTRVSMLVKDYKRRS